jgi:hypothetical protein
MIFTCRLLESVPKRSVPVIFLPALSVTWVPSAPADNNEADETAGVTIPNGSKADFQSMDLDAPDGKAFAQKYRIPGAQNIVILDGSDKVACNNRGLLNETTFNGEISKVVH